jgi:phosphate-selective porin OprO and OprP
MIANIKSGALLVVVLLAAAMPLQAAGGKPTVQQQLEALQKTLDAQQAQLAAQAQQIEAQRAQIAALQTQQQQPAPVAKTDAMLAGQQAAIDKLQQSAALAKLSSQEQPKTSFNGNRLTVTSADGRSSLAVRALVQLDAAHFSQDAAGPLDTDSRRGSVGATANRETDAARDLSDGAYFRRARFGVEGTFARNFNYKLLLELGGPGTEGPTRINDAWIAYNGFAPFSLQLGAYAPPANMADGTTPDDLLFIERASSAELQRAMGGADGRIGLGIRGSGARWMGALTLTSRTVNDPEVFDVQNALVARVGGLIATGTDYNVHVGANSSYIIHPADQGPSATSNRYGLRFRERPELRVDSTRLIDTGTIDADHAAAYGIEFAANWKNWLVQAEDTWFSVERRASTLSNPRFNGYYIEGSWVLTGESHRYNAANGSYQSPRPFIPFDGHGGWGAWELALRYSRTDLNYHAGDAGVAPPADGIRGGLQAITSGGVNWYPNPNLRFLLDYQHINVQRLNPAGPGNLTPFGPAPATPLLGVDIGQSYNAYALRSQYSF